MNCIFIASSLSVVRGAEVSREPNASCAVSSSFSVPFWWEGLTTGQSDSSTGIEVMGSCKLGEDGGDNCEDDSEVSWGISTNSSRGRESRVPTSRLEVDGRPTWRARPQVSASNEGSTEVEGVENPRVWWVEPSPAGTTLRESVEESEEESVERARGLSELEEVAREGEDCEVVVIDGSLELEEEESVVVADSGTIGDDRLTEGEHGAAPGVGVTPASCVAAVPGESAEEGREEDAATVGRVFLDSVVGRSSKETFSILCSRCSEAMPNSETSSLVVVPDECVGGCTSASVVVGDANPVSSPDEFTGILLVHGVAAACTAVDARGAVAAGMGVVNVTVVATKVVGMDTIG